MKAFIVDSYKSKAGMRLGEMPLPQLREDEVLVEVHATAVNLLDAKILKGAFKLILPYRTPFVLGHDVAGVVVRVGAGAQARQHQHGTGRLPAPGRPDGLAGPGGEGPTQKGSEDLYPGRLRRRG